MIDQQLRLLAQLAASDGTIDPEERALIENVGLANGLSHEDIQNAISSPVDEVNYKNLSDDEKFDYLYNLVHLMKIDGEVYNQEVEFCQGIAQKLGYQLAAVYELYPHVHPKVKIPGEIKALKQKVNSFLIKG